MREFKSWSTISFALSIQGCVATIASTLNTPALLGGPAAAVWAWFFGCFGGIALACSVAELISAYPTAGGMYATSGYIVPLRYRASVGWVLGWITFISQVATASSVNFALSQMILAAAVIGTDGSYVPTAGQTIGLYVAMTVIIGIFNSLPTKILHQATQMFTVFNAVGTLAVIIAVPVCAAKLGTINSSEYVWTTIIDQSGYQNPPFAFFLGILSVAWVLTDYDGTAHLTEEIRNPAVVAPVAIGWAVTLTSFFGFWVNVAIMYGAGDITSLPGPTGLVFAQVLWQNLGRAGALVLWTVILVVQLLTGVVCQLAATRSVYALSRDRVLPDFGLLAKVSKYTKTPVNAGIFIVVAASILGLLDLGSPVAINAVFSVTAVGLDVSYAIPTAFKLAAYLWPEKTVDFRPGPFYLGKAGYWINGYAVVWTVFETGILVMPQVYPVNKNTMNYAGPILGFVIVASFIWYLVHAKAWYKGPGGSVLTLTPGRVNSAKSTEVSEKELKNAKKD